MTILFIFAVFLILLYVIGLRVWSLAARKHHRSFARHPFALFWTVTLGLLALNFYVYHGFGYQPDLFRHGNIEQPWVAITFDDGPSPEFTPPILAALAEYNVPATFFLLGANVEAYPELAQAIVAQGHEVGNHTFTHINIPTAATALIYDEMVETTHSIEAKTGIRPQYVRPPRGLYDGRFRRIAAALGYRVVLWSLSSRDWRTPISAPVISKRIITNVKPGDILLFHDNGALLKYDSGNRAATVAALPVVIQAIRAKGLEIVPLSQLLAGISGEAIVPALSEEE